MNPSPRVLVESLVQRVRRRLAMRVLLHSVAVCWAIGLLAATLWFLLRPFTFSAAGETVRWAVPVAALGVATIAGCVLGWMRRPKTIHSALALDSQFGLKERITTLLTLPAEQEKTAAGQALLNDAHAKVKDLNVAEKFPVRLPWTNLAMPFGALLLAIGACFFDPILNKLKHGNRLEANNKTVDAKEIQQQLDNLRKVSTEQQDKKDQLKSEELKDIEAQWDKLVKEPLDPKNPDKIRERVNELRKLEDKIKERVEGLKEKSEKFDNLKKQLEKLSADKDKKIEDGPAKDLEDALSKGDFQKAKEMLDKLSKDLKEDKLSKEQQKKVAENFKDLQDKLQKLLDRDQKLQQMKKDAKDGKIDPEQLQKAMENFKDLQDLADLIGECKEGLENADPRQAAEKLKNAMEKFEQMKLTDEELEQLVNNGEALEDAIEVMIRGIADGEGEGEGMIDGMGGQGSPGTKRPINPNDPEGKTINERQRAHVDAKAKQRVVGFATGGNFTKIPSREVAGAFQQAEQVAPEVIERQRIPQDAADIARGYFRKLGNQK